MPPKFSLQPVLDYRHSRVEALEIEFASLLKAHQTGQIFLNALIDSRARVYEQMSECQKGEIDLFMASQLRTNLKMVSDRLAEQQARLNELEEQIQAKRLQMISAKQDKEALEKLREKERERFLVEQSLQENRTQDDLYIARAYRSSVSPA